MGVPLRSIFTRERGLCINIDALRQVLRYKTKKTLDRFRVMIYNLLLILELPDLQVQIYNGHPVGPRGRQVL